MAGIPDCLTRKRLDAPASGAGLLRNACFRDKKWAMTTESVHDGGMLRLRVVCGERRADVRVRRHPSESGLYLAARVLAFGLALCDGLTPVFASELCQGREPAVAVRGDDGGIVVWFDVGRVPDAARLRRAASRAGRVEFFAYGRIDACRRALRGQRLPRTTVWWIDTAFLSGIAELLGRPGAQVRMERCGNEVRLSGLAVGMTRLFPREERG